MDKERGAKNPPNFKLDLQTKKQKNAHEKYENHTAYANIFERRKRGNNSKQRQPLKLRTGNYQTEFIHFV